MEFRLVYIGVLQKNCRQKLRKLQKADFDQNWDSLRFFEFLTVSSTVFLANFMLK